MPTLRIVIGCEHVVRSSLSSSNRKLMKNFHDTRRNGRQTIIDLPGEVPLSLLVIQIKTEALLHMGNHSINICRRIAGQIFNASVCK